MNAVLKGQARRHLGADSAVVGGHHGAGDSESVPAGSHICILPCLQHWRKQHSFVDIAPEFVVIRVIPRWMPLKYVPFSST
jgi:hypothetical protein